MCYTINKCVAKLNITSLFFAFKVLFAIKVLASFVKEVPFFDLMCGHFLPWLFLLIHTRDLEIVASFSPFSREFIGSLKLVI